LFEQSLQQRKLTRREQYRLAVLRQLMGCRIHAQLADANHRVGAAGVSAQHGAHACRQLVEIEWLDEIVVGIW
jgi:hypothetical protein